MIFALAWAAATATADPPGDPLPMDPPHPVEHEEPVALSTDPWETLAALERERLRRAKADPIALFAAGVAEVATGVSVAAATDERTLGFGLVVGGVVHAATAGFAEDANHRRTVSFESRLSIVDRGDPGAADVVASQLRLEAERAARAHAFGLGAHAGVAALGGLLAVAGCTSVADVVGMSCDLPGSLSLVAVGLVGGVHHAARWRSDVRLAGDLAVLDERIPSVIP